MSTNVNNGDANVETTQPDEGHVGRTSFSALAARSTAAKDIPRRRGAQYFDTILWRIYGRMENADATDFLVGITGCGRRTGVSTVAANLAIRAADQGMTPTLLVDANHQHPRLRKLLKIGSGPGLAEVLSGRAAMTEAIRSTKVAGLDLLPLGKRELLERAGIDRNHLSGLLAELRHVYSLIFFDLPSPDDMRHDVLLAAELDGAILVIRAEAVRCRAAQSALNHLLADGVNVIGAVVTGQRDHVPRWLQHWL